MDRDTYAAQLNVVRAIAVDGLQYIQEDYAIQALQAVLTHYDAYAAVTEAVMDCARFDDLTVPVQDVIAPEEPEFANAARIVLDEALNAVMALEQDDARGIVRA